MNRIVNEGLRQFQTPPKTTAEADLSQCNTHPQPPRPASAPASRTGTKFLTETEETMFPGDSDSELQPVSFFPTAAKLFEDSTNWKYWTPEKSSGKINETELNTLLDSPVLLYFRGQGIALDSICENVHTHFSRFCHVIILKNTKLSRSKKIENYFFVHLQTNSTILVLEWIRFLH